MTWQQLMHSWRQRYGKSPLLMDESTISMAIFNSYVANYQRLSIGIDLG
jgi:hypothetical protein